ncbi:MULTISPECIES: SDR family NAD(P)-dependent oxidoreductase [unclassified Mesorhizobium]|uniref:SDR family NAD(P)-dependent oxidoreductase n=2 Tax=Mesorhizobium TaxID=68287 RepID=UPI000FC9BE31|nr:MULTISPECIES: SDR family NAD(P)-dependent oxidoreductase [unclassified Mesorhizobium]MDG4855910.1 SDR family NAD(P)-dependent oxidoreductase [Mesorhizobium sp. WSM4982]MDG4899766.1 SDR family NAD(P)-dependent oxidoreductase [Mesorhizobium sp. WSM4962]MDG4914582.1 SDR family NAD(P)-dependent oxidoreductase [Mesorhizobium sp. WSM4983]MDG4917999.1 SDR family NAD(P)-dependent oxidoreductase [Mesorhizobium sp. WSM4989]RUV41963.1 SDR family oxidoreductase [Mesorhizobium sp. M1A.T.Ca.IN.004.03.1.1
MIAGKHALVTGGGSGVGRAIALSLAEAGVAVTICGRRKAALNEVAKANDRIFGIGADVTDEADMTALYEKAEAARGPFEIVVANAGMAVSAPAHKTSLADWQRSLDVNLTGAFLAVQPALGGMLARKTGRIVFIASTAGLKGYAYVAPYVAAKHGVVGLMRALAAETAKSGITVNAICPGFVETDMLEESIQRIVEKTGRSADEARASLSAANPQARFIQPEEVAAAVLWLCGDAARSITGQAISVSGGETW